MAKRVEEHTPPQRVTAVKRYGLLKRQYFAEE